MFNLFKKKPIPDYQAELEWKYPDRPVVMSWTRWAIPRSNLHTTFIFIFFLVPSLLLWLFCYVAFSKGMGFGFHWKQFLFSFIPSGIFFACMCGMIFEHRFYVYRITEQGLEVYSWLEAYKKAVLLIKITLVVAGIALVVVAIHTGSIAVFFGALVGPAGFGLLGLTSMTSENFEKVNRNFDHEEFSWDIIPRGILIDKRRGIISIACINYEEEYNQTVIGTYPIYCDKSQLDESLTFFKNKFPNAPCINKSMSGSWKTYEGKPQTDEPYNYIKAPSKSSNDNLTPQ